MVISCDVVVCLFSSLKGVDGRSHVQLLDVEGHSAAMANDAILAVADPFALSLVLVTAMLDSRSVLSSCRP